MKKRARRRVGAGFFGVRGYGAGGLALDLDTADHDLPLASPGLGHAGPQDARWPEGEPNDVSERLTFDHNDGRMPYHEGAAPSELAPIDLGDEEPAIVFDESEFEPSPRGAHQADVVGGPRRHRDVLPHTFGADIPALELRDDPANWTRRTVPVSQLVGTQSTVREPNFPNAMRGLESGKLPRLVPQKDGRFAIDDGHHRITKQMLDGATEVEALVFRPPAGMEQDAERGVNLKELDQGRMDSPVSPYTEWTQSYDSPNQFEEQDNIHLGAADDELPRNPDGTVTLFHGTTKEGARRIVQTGVLQSAGEPDVYLSTAKTGTGYGDGTVVAVDVDPKLIELDDEFPDGRRDYRLHAPGKKIKVGNPRIAAGVPAVGDAARKLAGAIARAIVQYQELDGIKPVAGDERSYWHYFHDEERKKAEDATRAFLTEFSFSPFFLMNYLPKDLVKTEAAKARLANARIYLQGVESMPTSAGHLDPRTGHISLRVSMSNMVAPLAENLASFESTLAHEIRHALDWAYTGKSFMEKRHPGGQQHETERSREWWTKYLSNPTELMSWAGNVAYKLDHAPKGWEDLKQQLAKVTIKVLEKSKTAQVEMKDPGGDERIVDVPVIELIPAAQRPRFLQMILKAWEQLNPGYSGPRVNPWQVKKEDAVNRKKIPAGFMEKFLSLGYLYQVRDRMLDQTEYPTWQDWVSGNTSSQLAMELENNYDAYQVLAKLPKNQLDEYPDLEDMIERYRGGTGLGYVAPPPEPVDMEDFQTYLERTQRERRPPASEPEPELAPAEPVQARLRVLGRRVARPQGAPPWVAVDLDGTILSEAPGDAAAGRFGEVLPGAREALKELKSLGWRISIYTARFMDLGQQQTAQLKQALEQFLTSQDVPFGDVWTGRKPRADYFVDNKAVHFGGDWNQVLLALTQEGASAREPDEGDEASMGGGPADMTENDFGTDGMDNRRDLSLRRPPGVEEVLY